MGNMYEQFVCEDCENHFLVPMDVEVADMQDQPENFPFCNSENLAYAAIFKASRADGK